MDSNWITGQGLNEELSNSTKATRVKRPMNAFLLWSHCQRRALRMENPGMKLSEISVVLGKEWKALSTKERQPFLDEAAKRMKAHALEHPDYKYCPKKKKRLELAQKADQLQVQKASQLHPSLLPDSVRPQTPFDEIIAAQQQVPLMQPAPFQFFPSVSHNEVERCVPSFQAVQGYCVPEPLPWSPQLFFSNQMGGNGSPNLHDTGLESNSCGLVTANKRNHFSAVYTAEPQARERAIFDEQSQYQPNQQFKNVPAALKFNADCGRQVNQNTEWRNLFPQTQYPDGSVGGTPFSANFRATDSIFHRLQASEIGKRL